jgi:hypothetical protein
MTGFPTITLGLRVMRSRSCSSYMAIEGQGLVYPSFAHDNE